GTLPHHRRWHGTEQPGHPAPGEGRGDVQPVGSMGRTRRGLSETTPPGETLSLMEPGILPSRAGGSLRCEETDRQPNRPASHTHKIDIGCPPEAIGWTLSDISPPETYVIRGIG